MGRDDDRGGLQDTIPAGWDANGVLEGTNVDEPSSKSERARERGRERARDERRVKDSPRQKEKTTERQRDE